MVEGISGFRDQYIAGRIPCADMLRRWADEEHFVWLYSEDILAEYKEVLKRLYGRSAAIGAFIRMAKAGSTIAGLMECFGTVVSVSLQHGVPLKVLCEKLSHTRFEPSGWTGNAQIGYAKSVMDYIFRWLELRYLSAEQLTLFSGGRSGTSAGGELKPSPVDGSLGRAA